MLKITRAMILSSVLRCPYCYKEDIGNSVLVSGAPLYVEKFYRCSCCGMRYRVHVEKGYACERTTQYGEVEE